MGSMELIMYVMSVIVLVYNALQQDQLPALNVLLVHHIFTTISVFQHVLLDTGKI